MILQSAAVVVYLLIGAIVAIAANRKHPAGAATVIIGWPGVVLLALLVAVFVGSSVREAVSVQSDTEGDQ